MDERTEKLIAACGRLIEAWDKFGADDGSVNPLDYVGGETIEPIREALIEMGADVTPMEETP